jgi:hypothetical protein
MSASGKFMARSFELSFFECGFGSPKAPSRRSLESDRLEDPASLPSARITGNQRCPIVLLDRTIKVGGNILGFRFRSHGLDTDLVDYVSIASRRLSNFRRLEHLAFSE